MDRLQSGFPNSGIYTDFNIPQSVLCLLLPPPPNYLPTSPKGGIIVTENGTAVNEPSVEASVDDKARISFYEGYVSAMHEAIEQGADVRGYYAWSLMDNFGEDALLFSNRCASISELVGT